MSEWLPSTVLYRPWLWCEEKLWKLFAGIRFQSLPVASSLSWMVVGQHPSGIATADGTIKTSSLTGCENRNAYPHIPNECLRWWRWWRCRRPVHLLDGRNHHLLLSQMNPQLLLLVAWRQSWPSICRRPRCLWGWLEKGAPRPYSDPSVIIINHQWCCVLFQLLMMPIYIGSSGRQKGPSWKGYSRVWRTQGRTGGYRSIGYCSIQEANWMTILWCVGVGELVA